MPFQRTRWGLAAWNLLILVLVLATTLGSALVIEARTRDADIERQLRLGAQREMAALLAAESDDDHERPGAYAANTPDLFAFWVDRRGALVRNTRQVSLSGLPDAGAIQTALAGHEQLVDTVAGDVPVRLLSVPVFREGRIVGAVQVGASLVGARQSLSETLVVFVATGLAGVLLAGLGSVFLAGRAMRPIGEAFERQRKFLADASHELRTPVAVLRARAELLARQAVGRPERERHELEQLVRDADELSELLGELLDLARLQAGRAELRLEPVALVDVLEEIAAQCQPLAEVRRVEFATVPATVWARTNLAPLRQVLRALVDNALKHTPAGGRVAIEASSQGHWAVLRVVDNGAGIPAEHLPHVSDRFYRVDTARRRPTGDGPSGAGLGLSIAAELVRLLHGQMRIDSIVGRGTTVTILLPRVTSIDHTPAPSSLGRLRHPESPRIDRTAKEIP